MGLFNKNTRASLPVVHPAEQYFVRNELTGLKERLDTDEQAITARLQELEATTGSLSADRAALKDALSLLEEVRREVGAQQAETGRITTTVAAYVNEHVEQLSTAVRSLDTRIAALDGTVQSLATDRQQLQHLVTTVDGFQQQISDLQQRTGALQRRAELPDANTARLQGAVGNLQRDLQHGLGATNDEIGRLVNDLDAIRARVECALEARNQPPTPWGVPSPLPPPPGGAGELDPAETAGRLDELGIQLAQWIAESDGTTRQTAEQIAAIDQRLAGISSDLSTRLEELSRDIAALSSGHHAGSNGTVNGTVNGMVSQELIVALTERQVQLANEQARYEIAFRRDLAALAEDVHRAKGG